MIVTPRHPAAFDRSNVEIGSPLRANPLQEVDNGAEKIAFFAQAFIHIADLYPEHADAILSAERRILRTVEEELSQLSGQYPTMRSTIKQTLEGGRSIVPDSPGSFFSLRAMGNLLALFT